jgi:hypothetical protein
MCLKRLAPASLNLFRDIAKGNVQSEDGSQETVLYEDRHFLNTGPGRKVKGKLSLTNFGVIIYHAHLII